MITLIWVYVLAGGVFAAFAALSLRDRRWGNAAFWGLLALSMWAGDWLGNFGNGLLVLALVAIAGFGGLSRGEVAVDAEERSARAARFGNGLFVIAAVIPLTALAGTFAFKAVPALVEPKQATLVSLALGVLLALGFGYARLRPTPSTGAAPLIESSDRSETDP